MIQPSEVIKYLLILHLTKYQYSEYTNKQKILIFRGDIYVLHYNTEKCAIKTDKNIQSRYNQIQYKIRKYYSHKEKDNIYRTY